MLDELKAFYKGFSALGVSEIATLMKLTQLRKVRQDEQLVKAGDYNYFMFIVLSGALRAFITKTNGQERTVQFFLKGEVCGSADTAYHGETAIENVMALENGWIAYIDYREFEEAAKRNNKILSLHVEALKRNMYTTIRSIQFYTTLSPEERYLQILKERPNLLQKVPQKYLASYLGITPESLSRVRARTAKK